MTSNIDINVNVTADDPYIYESISNMAQIF
jgi:hypothetical protein